MCASRPVVRVPRGFTLLELLVVITVIIALAGLLFPVIGSVQERARKTQARSDLQQLVNAVNAYQTEYGKFPLLDSDQGGAQDIMVGSSGANSLNGNLMFVLRGRAGGSWNTLSNGTQSLNPKQVVFLEIQPARNASNPVSGIDAQGNWVDPWGGNYAVGMDSNYSGITSVGDFSYPDIRLEDGPTGTSERGVAAAVIGASKGKDKTIGKTGSGGAKTYKDSDDVITWQ